MPVGLSRWNGDFDLEFDDGIVSGDMSILAIEAAVRPLDGESISAADVRRSQATHAASIAQTDELRRLLGGSYRTAVYHGPEDGWSSSDGDTITITRAEATTA